MLYIECYVELSHFKQHTHYIHIGVYAFVYCVAMGAPWEREYSSSTRETTVAYREDKQRQKLLPNAPAGTNTRICL